MKRIDIDTSRGTMQIIYEIDGNDIIVTNVPLIGVVRVTKVSADKFCRTMLAELDGQAIHASHISKKTGKK